MLKRFLVFCLLCVVMLMSAAEASGDAFDRSNQTKGAAKGLDDQLLRDLDGAEAKTAGEPDPLADRQEPSPSGDGPQVKPVDPFAQGDELQSGPAGEVFRAIEKRMLNVQQRLSEMDTSSATQEIQRRIVVELDAVIQQLQQQMESQNSRSRQTDASSQQGQPTGKDGGETGDRRLPGTSEQTPADSGELAETEAMRQALDRFWGHLPERVRQQVQNLNSVEFLPEYQKLIEDYYRRMAEARGR
jgi:hypothetical protein